MPFIRPGRSAAPSPPLGELRWSDPATWGGSLPTASDAVVVSAGQTILLDMIGAVAQSVTIAGTLRADSAVDIALTTGNIEVGSTGLFEIGTEASPYTRSATLTLNGAESGRAARFVADVDGQSGGNGRLASIFTSTGAVAETVTVTFSSASAFTVSGSVSGSLGSGTVGVLFNNRVRFTATAGSTPWANGNTVTIGVSLVGFTNNGVGRSLQVQPGGSLVLIGNPPAIHRTRLNADASVGATNFTLAVATGWLAGNEVVIGPTDWFTTDNGNIPSQSFTLASNAAGTAISTLAGLQVSTRYGNLQYATGSGMSLTDTGFTASNCAAAAAALPNPISGAAYAAAANALVAAGMPNVLDERAPVVNLTRNIVIQAPNDSAWTNNGFGAHLMFMGRTSVIKIDGVEVRRGGQAGALGRYPFHFHAVSYNMPDGMTLPSDGTFLGAPAAGTQYIRRSSVNVSTSRAYVLHLTHGIDLSNNVAYNIKGHAIFLEDGAEKNNTITNNVVLDVRTPGSANSLQIMEREFGEITGMWISNPYNTVTGNWTADCSGAGWRMTMGSRMFGLGVNIINEVPINTPPLNLSGNISFCNLGHGLDNFIRQGNSRGNGAVLSWSPTDNNLPSGNFIPNVEINELANWKNRAGGYFNGVQNPRYKRWVSADNGELDFSGSTSPSFVSFAEHLLNVGLSLNNSRSYASINVRPRAAFATYHGTLSFRDSMVFNYPYTNWLGDVENQERGGGVFALWDLYLNGVEPTFKRSTNILKHTCPGDYHPNWTSRVTGLYLTTNAGLCSFSGAVHDPNGMWGPPGYFWIFDTPFHTYNAANLSYAHLSPENGRLTSSRFFGVENFRNNSTDPTNATNNISVDRMDGATVVGNFTFPIEHGFKHFAAMNGGKYVIVDELQPISTTSFTCDIACAKLSTDMFTMGIRFDGTVTSMRTTTPTDERTMSAVANLAAVEADTTGTAYWNDTTNNVLWFKFKGGLSQPAYPVDSDLDLFAYTAIRVNV